MSAAIANHHNRKRLIHEKNHLLSSSPCASKKPHFFPGFGFGGKTLIREKFKAKNPFREKFTSFNMGNFISHVFGENANKNYPDEVGLDVYKRWVDGSHDVADLTVATWRDEEQTRVVSRRVGDARKVVLESVAEAKERVRRVPYYKEALEKARRYDRRLSELQSEVKREEERLAGLRKAAEEVLDANIYIFVDLLLSAFCIFSVIYFGGK